MHPDDYPNGIDESLFEPPADDEPEEPYEPEPPQAEPEEPTCRIDLKRLAPQEPQESGADEPTQRIDVSAAEQEAEDNSAPTRRIDLSAGSPPPPVSPEDASAPTRKIPVPNVPEEEKKPTPPPPPPPPIPPQPQKGKRLRIVLIAVAAVLVVLILAGVLFVRRWFVRPNLPTIDTEESLPPLITEPAETEKPSQAPTAAPTEDPEPTETPVYDRETVQPKVSGERKSPNFFTFLIFGSDIASGNTDTMMVVSYDADNQKATVISLPRDTLINSASTYSKKLNNVYIFNGGGEYGTEALRREVSELLGFVPDFYVRIDWELVKDMVDAIGGVWFDVPYRMKYDDPTQDLHIDQETGYRLLTGDDAMQVVRWRHNNYGVPSGSMDGSDITRIGVQQSFLKAVLEQALQIKNLWKIDEIMTLFKERVYSNLTIENMLWLAQRAIFGGLKAENVEFTIFPYLFATDFLDRGFVVANQSALLTLINEKLNPFVQEVTLAQLDLMSVAPDGSHRSSTGILADPSMAAPPVTETPEPTPDPDATEEPTESGEPSESGEPTESGEPVTSGEPLESTDPNAPPESEVPDETGENGETAPIDDPDTTDAPDEPGSNEAPEGQEPPADATPAPEASAPEETPAAEASQADQNEPPAEPTPAAGEPVPDTTNPPENPGA